MKRNILNPLEYVLYTSINWYIDVFIRIYFARKTECGRKFFISILKISLKKLYLIASQMQTVSNVEQANKTFSVILKIRT